MKYKKSGLSVRYMSMKSGPKNAADPLGPSTCRVRQDLHTWLPSRSRQRYDNVLQFSEVRSAAAGVKLKTSKEMTSEYSS